MENKIFNLAEELATAAANALQKLIDQDVEQVNEVLKGTKFLDPDCDDEEYLLSQLEITKIDDEYTVYGLFHHGDSAAYHISDLRTYDLIKLLHLLEADFST